MHRYRALLTLTLACAALAGCSKAKTYTLRLDPKPGETYKYSTTVKGATEMQMEMSMKAVSVQGDKVVLEIRYGGIRAGGMSIPGLENMVMTVTEDRQGHATDTQVTGVPTLMADSMKKNANVSPATYPDKPLSVGDTWTAHQDVQGQSVDINFKLARIDTIGGKQAAVLEGTSTGGPLKMTKPMTVAIELSTGMPISSTVDGEVAGKPVTLTMTRQ